MVYALYKRVLGRFQELQVWFQLRDSIVEEFAYKAGEPVLAAVGPHDHLGHIVQAALAVRR